MNKTILTLAGCILLAANNPVSAAGTLCARSCATWIIHERENEWPAFADQSWLAGYLSGKAVANNMDFLRNTDSPSLYLWVSNYCQSHQLETIADAADELSIELARKKGLVQ